MFSIKKHIIFILLLCIFLVALALRVTSLGEFPVGFHIDEASLGYNGYSMLKTGKDESGKFLPLYINMFGDYRPSGYHYLTILPIAFFGLTEFATRFPGALFGALSVFAIYFLSYILIKDKKIALLSALFLALTPWHVVLSRASDETIVALFFIMIGFAFLLLSLRLQNIKYLVIGIVVSLISFFFYHTPRVFVPMVFLALLIFMFQKWKKYSTRYKATLSLSFIIVSLIGFFLVFGISGGTGRFNQVNIFSSFETKFQLLQELSSDSKAKVPILISRSVHNKVTNVSYMFISNYLAYFNGEFLFIKGGLPIWYSIPRVGILYLFELPFIVYGVYFLVKNKGEYYKIPLLWLLLGPIVSAITLDDIPNINRANVMFPMFEIIAAVGVFAFLKSINKKYIKLTVAVLAILLTYNVYFFLFQYFVNAKYEKPWYRNNGFSQMMSVVRAKYDSSDVILMTKHQGGIYPLVLFYLKYNPATYQAEGSPKSKDYEKIGKIMFVPQDCPFSNYSPNYPKAKHILYIEDGSCPTDARMKLFFHQDIFRSDGTKAFRIVYD